MSSQLCSWTQNTAGLVLFWWSKGGRKENRLRAASTAHLCNTSYQVHTYPAHHLADVSRLASTSSLIAPWGVILSSQQPLLYVLLHRCFRGVLSLQVAAVKVRAGGEIVVEWERTTMVWWWFSQIMRSVGCCVIFCGGKFFIPSKICHQPILFFQPPIFLFIPSIPLATWFSPPYVVLRKLTKI